jgi:pimeloyl-ACP methyl ester carboxylesterase
MLVAFGEGDSGFLEPKPEALWIAETQCGAVLTVPDAGHCPQSQGPEITAKVVPRFLEGIE